MINAKWMERMRRKNTGLLLGGHLDKNDCVWYQLFFFSVLPAACEVDCLPFLPETKQTIFDNVYVTEVSFMYIELKYEDERRDNVYEAPGMEVRNGISNAEETR